MEMRSESDAFRLNVLVNNTGRVTICSPDETHAIPGYGVCGGSGGADPSPIPGPLPGPEPEPLPEPEPEPLPGPEPLPEIM